MSGLDSIRIAGAATDVELPIEVFQAIDAGRSPDEALAHMYGDVARSSEAVHAKRDAMRSLEEAIRRDAGDLLDAPG